MTSRIAELFAQRGVVVGRVRLKGSFVVGHRSAKLHMPKTAHAVWRAGRARLVVETKCGRELLRATSVLEARDGLDLCDWCVLADYRSSVVYRFFDVNDVLLYVGFTSSFPQRLAGHRASSPWFSEAERWTLTDLPDDVAGLAYEAETIRTERPLYNVRHNEAALAAA